MASERLFLDTVYIQALLNQRDQYHSKARKLLPLIRSAKEVWTTEAVLTEVANALSTLNRSAIATFIEKYYQSPNIIVISVDTALFMKGLHLYKSRTDKTWGLTDCISFVVMQEQNLIEAVTADNDFVQAGFRALLLEQP